MLVFGVWILWRLIHGSLGGPVARQVWSEEVKSMNAAEVGAPGPSFYRLPVFLHAPGPLVPPELFQPVPHKTALPARLTALLVPSTEQHETGRDKGAHAVDVWCGMDTITVRVDLSQLRAWTVPARFRLGSCAASRVTSRYLFFHFSLMECGGDVRVAGGQLVYTFFMSYAAPPQDYVIRVFPLHLPIHCHYNRFHYSYQVGFRPQIQQTTMLKSLRSKLSFSLTVCNARWDPLPPGHAFLLGEPVYFLAQAAVLLAGERLYVDWCYATSSEDPNSSPRVEVISNHGCMTDSRREGSNSQFLPGGGAVLKFSVDAFLFRGVSQVQYLHCSLSVGLEATPTAKSCTYNKAAGRWKELASSSPVCSCCDSQCSDEQTTFRNRVRSSGWSVGPELQEEEKLLDEDERKARKQGKDQETRTGNQEEKAAAAVGKDWKSSAVEPRGGKQQEGRAAGRLEEPPSRHVMSDESRAQKNRTAPAEGGVPHFKSFAVTGEDGRAGSGPRSNGSSAAGVSTATACPGGGCGAAAGGPGAPGGSGTQRPVKTASVSRDGPPGNGGAGGHVSPELRPPERGRTGSGAPDTTAWSERIQCGRESVHGLSHNPEALHGAAGESEVRHLICAVEGSGSGSGSPQLNRSSAEGVVQGGGSSLEEMQEAHRGHSAVVVTTSSQDPGRTQQTGLVPEPDLLGFEAMQPAQLERELRRRLLFSSPDGGKLASSLRV